MSDERKDLLRMRPFLSDTNYSPIKVMKQIEFGKENEKKKSTRKKRTKKQDGEVVSSQANKDEKRVSFHVSNSFFEEYADLLHEEIGQNVSARVRFLIHKDLKNLKKQASGM